MLSSRSEFQTNEYQKFLKNSKYDTMFQYVLTEELEFGVTADVDKNPHSIEIELLSDSPLLTRVKKIKDINKNRDLLDDIEKFNILVSSFIADKIKGAGVMDVVKKYSNIGSSPLTPTELAHEVTHEIDSVLIEHYGVNWSDDFKNELLIKFGVAYSVTMNFMNPSEK